ncbi:hypothetical protein DXG03_005002 [Asterophora parasitica]|uniref:Large ribosomal subunit protein bL28c n=1 Tax=Asterophora parasitica TaxID=117018 RepID=A0A9P7GE78_9AGAR|nr:hypothetical protein DXG03_005002 [Asterophora parasitica]
MFPTLQALSASIVSQPFKRSQLGLFQGKMKQYGNNVPFSKHKTRRTWLPNVQRKRLFSESLGEDVRVKLTTRALRTIKKHGGLDKYVENQSSKILGWEGLRIRLKIRDHVASPATTVEAAPSAAEPKEVHVVKVVPPSEAKAKAARQAKIHARAELRRIAEKEPTQVDVHRVKEELTKKLGVPPTISQVINFLERQRKTWVQAAQFPVNRTQ